MTSAVSHRLDGLESDNLLAFLALLGLLRALEAADQDRPEKDKLHPRAAWDSTPPLRPRLFVARDAGREEILAAACGGLNALAPLYHFDGRKDLNYSSNECRAVLEREALNSSRRSRARTDTLASLMSDAAIKDKNDQPVDPTPLCLLFGQGHQHFLERLTVVPRQTAPTRFDGHKAIALSTEQCLNEALFEPWHRDDPTPSFRWDPEEDARYALMAGDPTDSAYKTGTQHGANRLAAIGLTALTLVPETRAGRVRPNIMGGSSSRSGFTFAWPIWRDPATLAAIRALLGHPDLRTVGALASLGVEEVLVASRIRNGKFMNFARARPLAQQQAPRFLEIEE